MKTLWMILCMAFALPLAAQDTGKVKKKVEYDTILVPRTPKDTLRYQRKKMKFRNDTAKDKKMRYRPTRLGSSAPQYDTYIENKRGAGAVTTNPKKIQVTPQPTPAEEVIADRDSTIRAMDSTQTEIPKKSRKKKSEKKDR